MEFSVLSPDNYQKFVNSQERCFYTQLVEYGEVRQSDGLEVERVGLVESGQILAAATIVYQPWKRIFRRATISYGPVLNWDDDVLVGEFFRQLRAFIAAKRSVLAIRVNPFVVRREYEDITPGETVSAAAIMDRVAQELGGTLLHREFYEDSSVQIRFAYTKDIGGMTYKEAAASCGQVVRTAFNRKGTNGVEVRFLGPDRIDVLARVLEHTASRTEMSEISKKTIEYYRELMERMGPDGAFLPVAILNCPTALADLDAERHEVEAKVAALEEAHEKAEAEGRAVGKKQHNALKEHRARLEVLARREAEVREVQADHGDEVELAASFFVHSPHELVYLVSGAYSEFQSFQGIYLIHRAMFEWATEHDVRWYNMFGISGDFSEHASDAGVLHFKRQFRGNVEEYVGTYDIPVHKHLAAWTGMIG